MTRSNSGDEWLSVRDLALWLNVPETSVRYWLQRGDAPRSHKVGRLRRFRRSDVEAWLAERRDDRRAAAAG